MDFPSLDDDYGLQLAVEAVNDTAGPNGFVPTLLVLGILPRALITPIHLSQQKERMEAMRTACDEMTKTISRRRLSTALDSNVPAATSLDVLVGSEILFHREAPVNKWVGPYQVRDMLGEHVFLEIEGPLVKFSVDKVKQYVRDSVEQVDDRAFEGNGNQVQADHEGFSIALDELITALFCRDIDSLKAVVDEPIHDSFFHCGNCGASGSCLPVTLLVTPTRFALLNLQRYKG